MATAKPSSTNFGFLDRYDAALVGVASLAERYFADDPVTCLMKLRQFGELLAQQVAARAGVFVAVDEAQSDLLARLRRDTAYPRDVIDLFHDLRRVGNEAVHQHRGDHGTALTALKVARQLAVWFHRTFGDRAFRAGPFEPPRPPPDPAAQLRDELERLRAEQSAALSATEAARRAAEEAEQALRTVEQRAAAEAEERAVWESLATENETRLLALQQELASVQAAAVAQPATLQLIASAAAEAAQAIDLDEQATRSLIDGRLRARGWEADTAALRYATGARPVTGRNRAIAEWPTTTGPADYVLFVGLTCVGIVEAKRGRRNVAASVDQAGRYSQGFLPEPGILLPTGGPWPAQSGARTEPPYRVPFLFSTNGRAYLKQLETQSGIWHRDARDPTNRRRALADWPTPDGLKAMLDIDRAAASAALTVLPFDFAFGLRDYQMRGIQAVEKALADDERRSLLLAMATGTGKTKLAVALLYRLLHTRRFRRVCFVVDRTALGDQAKDAFTTTRIVSTRTFADIFGLKVLGDSAPDPETKVHICTIQGLVKRVLFAATPEDVPPVDQYDLMLVDECHRGYTLDREMSDAELGFRSEADYVSKYRRVIEHFDAVRIGLTATPALHTTEIFGRPIFTYSLREAVIDGWLVDQEPPIRIETELSRDGIHFRTGETLPLLDPLTGTIDLTTAPDDFDFEVESFNRRVVTESFTRVVCEQLAEHIDPADPGKTLIFAASDAHADMVVALLGTAMEARYGSQDEALIRKITGSIDKPGAMIRRFRNDPTPKIAVTVDLLTTGIDVPKIVNLAFMRRVNSRILYDQMIGRATRLCPEIGGPGIDKESFRVFDAVRQSEAIGNLTEMKPVVVNPALSFTQLLDELTRVTESEQRALIRDQLLVRLRRRVGRLSSEAAEQFVAAAGETPADVLARVQTADPADLATWIATRPGLGPILDWQPDAGRPMPLAVSFHPDAHVATTIGYGSAGRPEDYLVAFGEFLRANENQLAALSLVLRRPRDLTQADLRALALALQEAGFSETALRSAWREAKQEDVAARLIGFVRQAALGDALEPWAVRVQRAVEAIIKRGGLTPDQQRWLRRIGTQVSEIGVADPAALDQGQFREAAGGFTRLDRVFGGRLAGLLGDINEAAWKDTA
jgi:type I restriction enzyme R subunit